MLLTISYQGSAATDLGYLLHKNPARMQSFELSFGQAHVFYPEATPERCTAALLLDVDPVALSRRDKDSGARIEPYVNDRAYAASSFLSVAMGRVFGTAMTGRSKERQELADAELPLTARIAALACRGGEALLRELFEPLGYAVKATAHALDERFPAWGESRYFTVELRGSKRVADLLSHLYVLIPVLDHDKHYWIGEAEVEKLMRFGEGWLEKHPARELIAKRYLMHRAHLTRAALEQLVEEDTEETAEEREAAEQNIEEPMKLWQARIGAVLGALRETGATRVLDLGCGEGKLMQEFATEPSFREILGMDVSYRSLEKARYKLRLDKANEAARERIRLIQGSLLYRDRRLEGFDAAVLMEVIEHLDPPRLAAFERVIFEHARPKAVIITTPNAEYNVKWETLPAGQFRHADHRFEWSRAEFADWAGKLAERTGYAVRYLPVGPEDAAVGAPTQMGVFTR
ncbi:MAG: 3' terminal RNA ribose 2'-O-methyltransferase Hen1 [Bryobacteraceae bacterium]